MRLALLDGAALRSMAEIHAALAQQLDFPDWYGGNLDALYDCLTEMGEETRISVLHGEMLAETLGSAYGRLCRVLQDAAEENPLLYIQL